MKWQPISSAPVDGTEILVGVDIATVWIVRNARWVNAIQWIDGDDSEGSCDTGWWAYCNSVTQERLEGIFVPQWWMPMPEPPK